MISGFEVENHFFNMVTKNIFNHSSQSIYVHISFIFFMFADDAFVIGLPVDTAQAGF